MKKNVVYWPEALQQTDIKQGLLAQCLVVVSFENRVES
jgi:hypothetical protein